MHPVLRNILFVLLSIFAGGLVNMAIIMVSGSIIPPPEGADLTTTEGLKASMHLFGPKNFIMPFLAHALGTFVGAYLAARLVPSRGMAIALGIGVLNFIGGAMMVAQLPSPLWFNVLDLGVAYLPMAYLAARLALKAKKA